MRHETPVTQGKAHQISGSAVAALKDLCICTPYYNWNQQEEDSEDEDSEDG
jgi:hypothetical protein